MQHIRRIKFLHLDNLSKLQPLQREFNSFSNSNNFFTSCQNCGQLRGLVIVIILIVRTSCQNSSPRRSPSSTSEASSPSREPSTRRRSWRQVFLLLFVFLFCLSFSLEASKRCRRAGLLPTICLFCPSVKFPPCWEDIKHKTPSSRPLRVNKCKTGEKSVSRGCFCDKNQNYEDILGQGMSLRCKYCQCTSEPTKLFFHFSSKLFFSSVAMKIIFSCDDRGERREQE